MPHPRPSRPAYGALASVMPDHIYEFSGRGFLFTSPWVHTDTRRHAATLLLSASCEPLVVRSGRMHVEAPVVLVPPLVARSLQAHDRGLVSINYTPHHWAFRAFRHMGGSSLHVLEAAAFKSMRGLMERAYAGDLTHRDAEQLADDCASLALQQLALQHDKAARMVRRPVSGLLDILDTDESPTLTEVAKRMHLSYDRASHAITSTLGLSLQSYQCWRKMAQVWRPLLSDDSLTAAAQNGGFSDSAHLARTWKQKLGAPPSYLRGQGRVRVIAPEAAQMISFSAR